MEHRRVDPGLDMFGSLVAGPKASHQQLRPKISGSKQKVGVGDDVRLDIHGHHLLRWWIADCPKYPSTRTLPLSQGHHAWQMMAISQSFQSCKGLMLTPIESESVTATAKCSADLQSKVMANGRSS